MWVQSATSGSYVNLDRIVALTIEQAMFHENPPAMPYFVRAHTGRADAVGYVLDKFASADEAKAHITSLLEAMA